VETTDWRRIALIRKSGPIGFDSQGWLSCTIWEKNSFFPTHWLASKRMLMDLIKQTSIFAKRLFRRRQDSAAKRHVFCLALMCVFMSPMIAWAQADNPLKPLDTSSPRATIRSFWEQSARVEEALTSYREEQTFEKYISCVRVFSAGRDLFDLSETPRAHRLKKGGAAFSYLHDILVRLPPVEEAEIPGGLDFDAEELEIWAFPETEIIIRRVHEGPGQNKYLFSADSVSRLPEFHAKIIQLPPLRETDYPRSRQEIYRFTGPLIPFAFTDSIPDSFRVNVFGTPFWKVLIASVLAVAIASITMLWSRLVSKLTSNRGMVGQLAWRATIPILLGAVIHLAYQNIISLQLNVSGDFALFVSSLVTIGISVSAMWAAWVLVHLLVETIIALPSIPEQSYDAHLLRLVARVVGVLAGVAILLWGANEIGIPAAGLLAGLGVGGFALALAAQSTVENLFGGVSIFADRPFRVGDFIHYGNSDGIVEMIGPRSSRIRGLDGTLTTVPNSDLSKMHITNYSMRNKCFFHHTLGVRYETTPEQFDGLLSELRRRIAAHPMVEETPDMPRIRLLEFGASSIDIDVRAYVLTTDFAEFLSVQQDLLLDIIRVVDEAGSGFAFPSVTNYLQDDRGIRSAALKPALSVQAASNDKGSHAKQVSVSKDHGQEGPLCEGESPAEDDP